MVSGRWSALLLAAGLAACATNVVALPPTQPVAAAAEKSPARPVTVQLALAPEDDQARAGGELMAATQELSGTSLFFETGEAKLSPDGKVRLLRVADVLRRYPQLKVRIEGNADERGASGYNIDLGTKRARVARDFLVSMQVRGDQVVLISNGADRPLAPGHSEDAWQVNRRDDVNLVQDKTPAAPAVEPAHK